jgi:hypothetical protein
MPERTLNTHSAQFVALFAEAGVSVLPVDGATAVMPEIVLAGAGAVLIPDWPSAASALLGMPIPTTAAVSAAAPTQCRCR